MSDTDTATATAGDTLTRLAAAYAAEFTPDASYVAFTGDVMRGRAAIEDVHRWLAPEWTGTPPPRRSGGSGPGWRWW